MRKIERGKELLSAAAIVAAAFAPQIPPLVARGVTLTMYYGQDSSYANSNNGIEVAQPGTFNVRSTVTDANGEAEYFSSATPQTVSQTQPTTISVPFGGYLSLAFDAVLTGNINPEGGTSESGGALPSYLGLSILSTGIISSDTNANLLTPIAKSTNPLSQYGAPTRSYSVTTYTGTGNVNTRQGPNGGKSAVQDVIPVWGIIFSPADVAPNELGYDLGDGLGNLGLNGYASGITFRIDPTTPVGVSELGQFASSVANYANATDFIDSQVFQALSPGMVTLSPYVQRNGTQYWIDNNPGVSNTTQYFPETFGYGDIVNGLPNLVIDIQTSPVPEPSSLALLAAGLALRRRTGRHFTDKEKFLNGGLVMDSQKNKGRKILVALSLAAAAVAPRIAHGVTLTMYYGQDTNYANSNNSIEVAQPGTFNVQSTTKDAAGETEFFSAATPEAVSQTQPTTLNVPIGGYLSLAFDAVLTGNPNPEAGAVEGTGGALPSYLGLLLLSTGVTSTDTNASLLTPVARSTHQLSVYQTGHGPIPTYNSTGNLNQKFGPNGGNTAVQNVAPIWATLAVPADVAPNEPGFDLGDGFGNLGLNGYASGGIYPIDPTTASGVRALSQFGSNIANYANATDFVDSQVFQALSPGIVTLSPYVQPLGSQYWVDKNPGASNTTQYGAQTFRSSDTVNGLPILVIDIGEPTVPEPKSLAALAIGAGLMLGRRRSSHQIGESHL